MIKMMEPPPPMVGYWQVGASGLRMTASKRPRWLTRQITRVLLEWTWVDATWQKKP